MKTPRIRRVLVAVKPFGHSASVAVARARLFAEHTAAEVALLGCVPDVGLGTGIGAGLGTELAWGDPAMLETLERAWAERAREALEELAQPLKYLGKRLTILARAHSPVYEGILEEVASWQADLLVVGVHEPTPLPHTRLTDTDWQLIRLCPCPLLLARDPALARYGTVLAAVDPLPRHGEPPGLDRMILETAHDIADAFAARLCTATAFPESSSPAAAPKTAAGAEGRSCRRWCTRPRPGSAGRRGGCSSRRRAGSPRP